MLALNVVVSVSYKLYPASPVPALIALLLISRLGVPQGRVLAA